MKKYALQTLQNKKGQTLIILLLVLVVTLTVGLSVVSRTVTNVRESATTERSTRAFDAAEAGIESVLRADISSPSFPSPTPFTIGNATANITVTQAGGLAANSQPYQPTKPVLKDDVLQLNLSGSTASSITIEWSLTDSSAGEHEASCVDPANPKDSALEISVLNVTGDPSVQSSYVLNRYAYRPWSCNISAISSGWTIATDDTSSGLFANKAQITINGGGNTAPKIMRIRPLFHDASMRITPVGGNFPVQSYLIRSTGTAGDATRVVQVEKTIGGLPSIFDYVLYNGSTSTQLTHQ